jgi:hypothetical protein
MKRHITITLAVLAVAAVAVFFLRPDRGASASPEITIHFTCDTAGRLEPCGCFSGQHGGLTRLRTWLDSEKERAGSLRLDVGGAIAGQADYNIIQHKYLARAFKTMGFSALNMGGREAMLPAADLAAVAKTSPVPLISASLVDASTRESILPPYEIVEIGGKRIGILGVVSPQSVPTPGQGLAILSLNEAIDRHLSAMSGKTDLNILLAFATEPEMRRIAKDYFEFAVILGGDVPGPAQEIVRENDSVIVFTTNQARTVGTLEGTLTGEERTRLKDPKYDIELLWDNIPQDPALQAMVKEYRSEIRNTELDIDDTDAKDPNAVPGVVGKAHYVGSASCQSCHADAHQVWEKSGHAHAFETLVKIGADADPNCIGCHTVGFGQNTGYRRPLGSDSLTDVGCESCHGPASEHLALHLEGKATNFKFRPLGPGDCTTCHYGEFSRPFEWDKFWPGISHK